MTGAFQTSAFQNNAFQTGVPPCSFQSNAFQANAFQPCPGGVAKKAGGLFGERRRRRVPRDPWAQTLSRQNYAELQELLAQERAAAELADTHKSPSVRVALGNALAAVSDSIEELERTQDSERMGRISAMLRGAVSAGSMRNIVAQAVSIENYVDAYLRMAVFEAEQEEDAIALLLMDA